jgi:hypothetical protein
LLIQKLSALGLDQRGLNSKRGPSSFPLNLVKRKRKFPYIFKYIQKGSVGKS